MTLLREHFAAGHELLVLRYDSKIPLFPFRDQNLTRDRIEWLVRKGHPYAVVMRERLVGIDCDDLLASQWAQRELPPTPWRVDTSRGPHLYFQADPNVTLRPTQGLNGYHIDIRAGNSFLVAAGSRIRNKRYELSGSIRAACELPVIPVEKLRKEVKPETRPVLIETADMSRVLRYVDKAEPAISGQRGHSRILWLGSRLLKVFPWLTEEQLTMALLRFNERCQPPFDQRAIDHKVSEAFRLRR